ncbi:MAG: hypothetical protein IPL93_14605 [Actinomycetales bacterium]|nr:hypothetical protein [Actinomycetales bacterium]
MRFTGRATASHNSMTLAWLTDTRDPSRLDYDERLPSPDRHRALGGCLRWCAPVPSWVLCSPEVCCALGLPEGTVTVAGMTDRQPSTVGSGAVLLRQGHFAVSTTTRISAPVAEEDRHPPHHRDRSLA